MGRRYRAAGQIEAVEDRLGDVGRLNRRQQPHASAAVRALEDVDRKDTPQAIGPAQPSGSNRRRGGSRPGLSGASEHRRRSVPVRAERVAPTAVQRDRRPALVAWDEPAFWRRPAPGRRGLAPRHTDPGFRGSCGTSTDPCEIFCPDSARIQKPMRTKPPESRVCSGGFSGGTHGAEGSGRDGGSRNPAVDTAAVLGGRENLFDAFAIGFVVSLVLGRRRRTPVACDAARVVGRSFVEATGDRARSSAPGGPGGVLAPRAFRAAPAGP